MTVSDRATDLGVLIASCAAGDQDAFARTYDLASTRVYGMVLRVLRDEALTEEVTQEVFLEIWQKASSFRGGGTAWGWVLAIAHRRAVDRVRSVEAARRRDERYANEPVGAAVGPEDTVVAAETGLAVRQCLETLSAVQRHAIELAYWAGLTQHQIAEKLGAPLGTVKSRVRDGLRELAACLRGVHGGDNV
ncbi:sigma-70 family RNA polymerase sigma factor [Yimella radicis]